jgi:hypothetical protein
MSFARRIFTPIGRGIRKWIPNVIGQTRTNANSNLNVAGFNVGTQTETTTNNTALDQQIISTTPAQNTQHGPGEPVNYNYYQYVAPFFPPFFPPSFGPFFPPFFPPGFGPFFPPFFPPWFKSGKSIGIDTLIRTPGGLVPAIDLEFGDIILSADIEGFPYNWSETATNDAYNWESPDPQITLTETTIVGIAVRTSEWAVVINNDLFSETHYVLIMRDGVAQFIDVKEVVETDLTYSFETGQFEEIYLLEKIEAPHEVVCINTEPYDVFFTENMLVHDSHNIQNTPGVNVPTNWPS